MSQKKKFEAKPQEASVQIQLDMIWMMSAVTHMLPENNHAIAFTDQFRRLSPFLYDTLMTEEGSKAVEGGREFGRSQREHTDTESGEGNGQH